MRNKNSVPVDPNEWDFRGLKPEHSYAALRYELAREHPQVQEAMALLTPERRKEIEALAKEDWEKWKPQWVEKESFWSFWPILRACWFCGQFPAPWTTLADTDRAQVVEKCGAPWSPLRILTREELRRIEGMEEMMMKAMEQGGYKPPSAESTTPIRRYIIEIDWSKDDPLLKPLLLAMLKLRPKGTRPHKRHTGKRAANPMHKFKQLAAWRLATKGWLNFKEASQLIDQRKKDFPKDDPSDLLPCYRSPGAWKDAVDAGQKLVRRAC